jgi:hypothetical protein
LNIEETARCDTNSFAVAGDVGRSRESAADVHNHHAVCTEMIRLSECRGHGECVPEDGDAM